MKKVSNVIGKNEMQVLNNQVLKEERIVKCKCYIPSNQIVLQITNNGVNRLMGILESYCYVLQSGFRL